MTASRTLAEYYQWEETDRGIRIFMHSGMADRLQAEILRAADGGTEVGGILLGCIEEDGGKAITCIDDFAAVPCSYLGGPLYTLSGEDTVHLETVLLRTALAGCESPDAPSVLGYYRSHLRDGLWLSPADLPVIDSYFQAPDSVFLVVKALANAKACTAGFFFWEDGQIQTEFSPLEVALARTPSLPSASPPAAGDVIDLHDSPDDDASPGLDDHLNDDLPDDLAALFRKAAVPEPGIAPAIAPALEPEASCPPPGATAAPPAQSGKAPRAWQGLWVRVATISIATAALVISAVTYLGAPRPPREEAAASTPAASVLGLHVDRNPPDLLVSWNPNAREIVAARRATLSIRDGRAERSVDLDVAQLSSGSYLYRAASDDLQFRLEVYGADEGSVAQSIRISPGSPR
jgi:hypothetical protein